MTREEFIRKWLGNPEKQYTEQFRDEMREDLDKVTDKALSLGGVSKSLLIIEVLNEYIKLLGEELNDTSQIAAAHGWKSNRIEQGNKLRTKLVAMILPMQ